jgi:hypothetical protein
MGKNPGGIRLAGVLCFIALNAASAEELSRSPDVLRPVRFSVVSPVSDEFVRRAETATQLIPAHVWSGLEHSGWSVQVARFVTDAAPALRGVQPRGWPAGSTWENSDAVHLPGARTLVFAELRRDRQGRVVESSRIEGVMRHEIGHAFDQASGPGKLLRSSSPAFVAAYAGDVRRIAAADRKQLAYYLQRGAPGRQETFAEAFGILLGGGSDQPHHAAFARAFPGVLDHVRRAIEEFGVSSRAAQLAARRPRNR